MTLRNLLLFVFAATRITEILVWEKIFQPLRKCVGLRYYQEDNQTMVWVDVDNNKPIRKFLADLFTCERCMSVWVAAFMVILYKLAPKLSVTLAEVFTVAYGTRRVLELD